MKPALGGLLRHTGRVLVRSLGYRGPRPGRALGVVVAVGGLVTAAATAGLAVAAAGLDETSARVLLPSIVLLSGYAVAGPLLLIGDSVRGGASGHATRALAGLPLSRRQLRLLEWAPAATVSLVGTAALVPPAVAMLIRTGGTPAGSTLAICAVLASSDAAALVILAAVKLTCRGPSWRSAHYPITLLLFGVATVLVVGAALRERHDLGLVVALLTPLVVNDVQVAGTAAAGPTGLVLAGSLAVCAAAAAAIVASDDSRSASTVVARWRPSPRASWFVGELVHVARSGAVLANLVAAALLNTAIVAGLHMLPREAAAALALPAVLLMASLSGTTARMCRGLYHRRWPEPQLSGASLTGWLGRLSLVSLTLFGLGLSPAVGAAILGALAGNPVMSTLRAADVVVVLIIAAAVAVGLTWLLPSAPDDPAGQVLGAAAYLVVTGAVTWLVLSRDGGPTALALLVGALVAATPVLAARVERRRWQAVPIPETKELA